MQRSLEPIIDPKAYVRYEYQHMLDGYKIYKPNY